MCLFNIMSNDLLEVKEYKHGDWCLKILKKTITDHLILFNIDCMNYVTSEAGTSQQFFFVASPRSFVQSVVKLLKLNVWQK